MKNYDEYARKIYDAIPKRGDVGYPEATSNAIFLLQNRRWQINHEGLPYGVETADDGDFIDTEDPVADNYFSIVEFAQRFPEHVYEEWVVQSVWFTRKEAEDFAKSTSYRYPQGWRVYCVCAEGEMAKVVTLLSNSPYGARMRGEIAGPEPKEPLPVTNMMIQALSAGLSAGKMRRIGHSSCVLAQRPSMDVM